MTLGTGNNKYLLLYGSETGQAKAIAEEIAERSTAHGLEAELHCLSLTEKRFWLERRTLAVIIVSTTGDGDSPDTATKFFRRLKKRTLAYDHLAGLKYSLLGLGDSNYTNFCNCGKSMNERLLGLGAQHFYDPAWADDAVGLEIVADPWMEGLFPALRQELGIDVPVVNGVDESASSESSENDINSQNTSGSTEAKPLTDSESQINKTISNDEQTETSKHATETTSTVTSSVDSENLSINTSVVTSDRTTKNQTEESERTSNDDAEKVSKDSEMTDTESHAVAVDCLTHSLPPLCESPLSVPAVPESYLQITYSSEESVDLSSIPLQNGCPLPTSSSPVTMATVSKATVMTQEDAVKKALKMELDVSGCGWEYEPGDSFSIVCPNPEEEVMGLLERLGVGEHADTAYVLSVIDGTKKKNASVPAHLPTRATLRHTLTTCCDIRVVPKKAFLRALAAHTKNESEQRRLLELCSRQGSSHFTKFLREPSIGVFDLLTAFPSCTPPITVLLEHFPRLPPRPYSIASCSSVHPDRAHFVFNVLEIPAGQGRHSNKQGICTGWLNEITGSLQVKGQQDMVEESLNQLNLEEVKIPVYLRSNPHFRPPTDLGHSVIMIGPGTGVAPFVGFLQHRQHQLSSIDPQTTPGPCWLLYGCRHQDRDFLFREELESFHNEKILSKLLVSFSRDDQEESAPRYVQDNIRLHASDICELLMEPNTRVYVCGDAKNMARGVNQALAEALVKEKGMNQKEAEGHLMQMRLQKRYLEDVWT